MSEWAGLSNYPHKPRQKQSMAIVSIAARVFLASLAGGAGYATVQAGVWEDGKNSQQTLAAIRDRLANIKPEIVYPTSPSAAKESVAKVTCLLSYYMLCDDVIFAGSKAFLTSRCFRDDIDREREG